MPGEIDRFLGSYPDNIGALAQNLRAFVKSAAPGCSETLHPGWKVISYGHRKKFCAIAPHAKWVNLQFHAGTTLEDPNRLLEGTGKSIRHVKVRAESDLSDELAALISQAGT